MQIRFATNSSCSEMLLSVCYQNISYLAYQVIKFENVASLQKNEMSTILFMDPY